MIRVSVLYPNKAGAKFDHDYYKNKHMKLAEKQFTSFGLKGVETNKGISGPPGQPAPFVAAAQFLFSSLEDLNKALEAHGKELMDDIPNYTNIEPQIQVSEVVQ